jgi:PTH2 family peptidyl-tRNA hydrolase
MSEESEMVELLRQIALSGASVKVEGAEFLGDERLTILANSNVSRGKFAAAAVHAALMHYGIPHGAVIVLGASANQIERDCELVVRDAGRTEVEPGTVTAGMRKP